MKTEEVIWRLIAVYKGKDGYGYGTTQTKALQIPFGLSMQRPATVNEES